MSILSPRNFLSPFTNTVNLVAIILVILLFAVFRFSMGRYQVQTRDNFPKAETMGPSRVQEMPVVAPNTGAAAAPALNQEPPPAVERGSTTAESDLEREIQALSRAGKQEDAQLANEAARKKQEDPGLKEVEKALGLR